jgi:hypothetical protein
MRPYREFSPNAKAQRPSAKGPKKRGQTFGNERAIHAREATQWQRPSINVRT